MLLGWFRKQGGAVLLGGFTGLEEVWPSAWVGCATGLVEEPGVVLVLLGGCGCERVPAKCVPCRCYWAGLAVGVSCLAGATGRVGCTRRGAMPTRGMTDLLVYLFVCLMV